MSQDIDRRIAIEIFGEEEPPEPDELSLAVIHDRWRDGEPAYSKGRAWSYRVSQAQWGWWPLRFSSSPEEARRAFDRWVSEVLEDVGGGEPPVLYMEYWLGPPKLHMAKVFHIERWDESLETAICLALLALKEKK